MNTLIKETKKSDDKAIMHLLAVPFVLAIISNVIESSMTIIAPIAYLIIIVAYFNLKNLFSNKSSLVEDAKAINSLATKIIVVLIITILIVLATIVGA